MTRIKVKNKPIWRETGMGCDGRPILVALTPINLLLRLKGTRQVLEMSWSRAFLKAAQDKATLMRLERINRRKAARKGNK